MKRLILIFFLLLAAVPLHAQTGALLPALPPQFINASGVVASGAKLCSTATGSNTNLATYSASDSSGNLSAPLPNPITLNALGQPTTSIGTPVAIYIQERAYRFTLYAAGPQFGTNTCNGVPVGAQIWQRDPVFDASSLPVIDSLRFCDRYTGANAGIKIAACVAALPARGGVAVASGFEGAQTSTVDWFAGHQGVTVILGAATFSSTVSIIVPTNSNINGIGNSSVIQSSSVSAPSGELIRLQGDYASISDLHLKGSGQVTNSVDGRRGIWIGCGTDQTVVCVASYNRVENVLIDQFVGNGIAGDMKYAKLIHNVIQSTTDSGIFLQPSSTDNLLEDNTVSGTRYSGFDINGSANRIVNNRLLGNGGGNLDSASQSGILIGYNPVNDVYNSAQASLNIIEGNTLSGNLGCGVLVNSSATTAGRVNLPYGNIIRGNTATGHVTYTGGFTSQWMGGICLIGGNQSTVSGNVSCNNTFNYVVSGISNSTSPGNQLLGNQSCNATTNAGLTGIGKPSGAGFFFPGSARIDAVGGSPATDLLLRDNWDRFPAAECYRWSLDGATALTWNGWTIGGNHCEHGTYGFNVASPGSFSSASNRFLDDNYAIGTLTAPFNGINPNSLTANSATPSVANGTLWATNNNGATVYTNFLSAVTGQHITVVVADANSSFDFTGTSLKGNSGTDFTAASGDSLGCTYNGTNWYCVVNALTGFPDGAGAGVTQQTNKSTAVTVNGVSGIVTMNNAALANTSGPVSFTMTNNAIKDANTQVRVQVVGGPNPAYYVVTAAATGAGGATVSVYNTTGSLSDAVVVGFKVLNQ